MMNRIDTNFGNRVRDHAQRLQNEGVVALGALFDLTSLRLVRLAVSVTRHQHDAEDAVQAVLVRVADRPAVLAQADCPWSYLLRMVRNEALAVHRRRSRAADVDRLSDLMFHCEVDELEQEEKLRAVWRAMRKLPPEQSEVVVLKIWEELTFREIESVLDIPANTAASRFRYAMEKLTSLLRPLEPEPSRDQPI